MPTNIMYREKDGATQVPGSTEDYGQVVSSPSAEVDTERLKICLENISDRALGVSPFTGLVLRRVQIGLNDGITFVGFTALDTANGTLSKPWGVDVDVFDVPTGAPTAADDSAGGSWGGTGPKGVRVTAHNATGETIGSEEKVFNVGDVARKWRYDWVETPDATFYDVYVTDTPGDYSAARRQTVSPGSTTFLVDDGSTGATAAIPEDNTSGGAGPGYGTAPSIGAFTAADKTIATAPEGLAVGQQWFFWIVAKVPAGATSLGNKRAMGILPKEV